MKKITLFLGIFFLVFAMGVQVFAAKPKIPHCTTSSNPDQNTGQCLGNVGSAGDSCVAGDQGPPCNGVVLI